MNNKTAGIFGALLALGLYYGYKNKNKIMDWIAPVTGRISSPFGARRVSKATGKVSLHNGIDIAIPVNTSIKAPMDGKVIVSGWDNTYGGGNMMKIKHINGYVTGYAHLNKMLFKVGETVKQGQEIALSGNTGRSTGAHLHFTLTDPKNNRIDPFPYFFKA